MVTKPWDFNSMKEAHRKNGGYFKFFFKFTPSISWNPRSITILRSKQDYQVNIIEIYWIKLFFMNSNQCN